MFRYTCIIFGECSVTIKKMVLTTSLLLMGSQAIPAPKLVEVLPVHSQLIMIHIDEGEVIHHGKGQKRSDEKVLASDLNVAAASSPASYAVTSSDDAQFSSAVRPTKVGRKSKGTQFAWFVDSWANGQAVNSRKDHAKEHWIYLQLPKPLAEGRSYRINLPALGLDKPAGHLTFSAAKCRTESLHVNLLGYLPQAPAKFGYLYHWAGDLGSLDFKDYAGKPFHLLKESDGSKVFTGEIKFRKPASNQETSHVNDSPPHGSFLKAAVYECDFSSFSTPGSYVLSVPALGRSFPFEIGAKVLRPAFYHTARALYHNRSGIELKAPYTEFTRPAPHNTKLTPGFKGKLMYTTVREQEWGSEGGTKEVLEKGFKGALEDTFGWYQDAGDWDGYTTHLRVAQELLFAYEVAPENFKDGDLNTPESGNKVPDLLDEAAWLPRYGHRLRQELMKKKWGTGGVSFRVAGDAFGGDGEGVPSYLDTNRIWAVAGEDPVSTYRYAGVAAHLAHCYKLAKVADPEGVDWVKEAKESFAWAKANTKPGDEASVKPHRAYAAASLFRITGDDQYQNQFAEDTKHLNEWSQVWDVDAYPAMVAALGGGVKPFSSEAGAIPSRALLNTALEGGPNTAEKRALRWGGNFNFPMLVGQQTTPVVLETAVAYAVTKQTDPPASKAFFSVLCTTADYFLGTNSLNQTWITGVGERYPREIFHMDAWYNGKGRYHPGLIPYSPWRNEGRSGEGPWSQFWPYKTIYPAKIEDWPGNEQWFSNRCSPMGSEFTVHQNIGPAAAFYGILAGKAD